MQERTLKFCGIDGWDRVVFMDSSGNFYKSISVADDNNVEAWDAECWKRHIETIHDTDSFDGEPGYPVDIKQFKVISLPGKRVVHLDELIRISVDKPQEDNLAPSKVIVSVGRTIQERPYEPYNTIISMEFMPQENADLENIDEHIEKVRSYLESKIDAWCEARREAAKEEPIYR